MGFASRQNLRGLCDISLTLRYSTLNPCEKVEEPWCNFRSVPLLEVTMPGSVLETLISMCGVRHRHRLRASSPSNTIVTIVKALALSHIRYCLLVYGNCTMKDLGSIKKVLNFAVRAVFGRHKHDHSIVITLIRERYHTGLQAKLLRLASTRLPGLAICRQFGEIGAGLVTIECFCDWRLKQKYW